MKLCNTRLKKGNGFPRGGTWIETSSGLKRINGVRQKQEERKGL